VPWPASRNATKQQAMTKFIKFTGSFLLALLIASCNGSSNVDNSPELSTALTPMPLEERRIGILHSDTSAEYFYDRFVYNQVFATMQQLARQAGLPYDLLNESDMTDSALLSGYDAVVMPIFSHIGDERAAIRSALADAQAAGTGFITAGDFMTQDDSGQYYADYLAPTQQLIGITPQSYVNGEPTTLTVNTTAHPVTESYSPNEQIASLPPQWFANYEPFGESNFVQLVTAESDGTAHTAVIATDNTSRWVHFSNDQMLTNTNLAWRAMQWLVYNEEAPVALQLSRSDSIVLARNDMDETMYPQVIDFTHRPLLEILQQWKEDFNFTGSHYIDIGNDPDNNQFTDWSVTQPLMQQYLDLGIEIGTHSWTHPFNTSFLTDSQLEFEFNQSKAEIETQLNINVTGGAIPGNSESLRVVENLNQWFEYFSGRPNPFSLTQPAAIGFLEPWHDMIYFSINMSPDFTLADFLNNSPEESEAIWREEIDSILTPHAQQPIMHWVWHDYAPTTGLFDGTYSRAMFDNTIAYMYERGAEFVTLDNMHNRIRDFADTQFSVGVDGTIDATVNGNNLGQFSLQMASGYQVNQVTDWYAYSEDKVFIPENGGQFTITAGDTQASLTRLSKLPMRARLIDVNGDGNSLSFTFSGSGPLT